MSSSPEKVSQWKRLGMETENSIYAKSTTAPVAAQQREKERSSTSGPTTSSPQTTSTTKRMKPRANTVRPPVPPKPSIRVRRQAKSVDSALVMTPSGGILRPICTAPPNAPPKPHRLNSLVRRFHNTEVSRKMSVTEESVKMEIRIDLGEWRLGRITFDKGGSLLVCREDRPDFGIEILIESVESIQELPNQQVEDRVLYHCFEINAKEKVYQFSASSREEQDFWLEVLRSEVLKCKVDRLEKLEPIDSKINHLEKTAKNQVLLLEDYLWKKENLSDAWKYWKFALYNNSLRCYAPNEKVDVALATIQLRSVKCVKLLENKKIEQQDKKFKFQFLLETENGRKYQMGCSEQVLCINWVTNIQEAVALAKKEN
ncbi:uncharacterized protein [Oscarella lobularis]